MGTGREGVAIATALLAKRPDQDIIALDGSAGDSVVAWQETFGDRAPVIVVDPEQDDLRALVPDVQFAIMSPGVPLTGSLHRAVAALGIPMTSGSALFTADHRHTMVGVTGSKGKSTTSTLLHHLLVNSGVDSSLGGNMGIPVQGLAPSAHQVVEFSSYQCHYLEASPAVVVLTALFPEHLDWHGSLDAYYGDKLRIVANKPTSIIANGDDAVLRHELSTRYPDAPITWVGEGELWHLEPDGDGSWLMRGDTRLAHSRDTPLMGQHNHRNVLLALAGASATGLFDESTIASGLASFQPLPNRLERIADPSGIVFVNDSLATNPQAAAAALRAFAGQDTVMLIGGYDRGVDYTPLVEEIVATRPVAVIGLPGSGSALVELCTQALRAAGTLDSVTLMSVSSMEEALRSARRVAGPGYCVVLSPGAPSFGQYLDYQHRADDFRYWITETAKGTP